MESIKFINTIIKAVLLLASSLSLFAFVFEGIKMLNSTEEHEITRHKNNIKTIVIAAVIAIILPGFVLYISSKL